MVSFFALLGAAILVGFAVMKARASAPFRRVVVPGHLAVGVRIARRRSLVRIAIAIAVAVVVGVAGLGVNAATPDLFGLPLLLTPLAMTCAGFIVIAVWPQVAVAETAVHRSADLIPRGPWSYIPGWSLALTAFSAVLVLVAVLVFGVTSSPQPDGLFRAVQVDALPYSSTAGPYPGWFYGVPIGVMIAGTALVAVLALVRVSSAPRPTDTTLREVDQIMRMILTRVVAKFAAGTFTVYVGGMVFFGGAALQLGKVAVRLRERTEHRGRLLQPRRGQGGNGVARRQHGAGVSINILPKSLHIIRGV